MNFTKILSSVVAVFAILAGLYKFQASIVWASDYSKFKTQQQLHWTDYNIDRLMAQYMALSSKKHLSPVERQWLNDIKGRLDKYRQRHDLLEKRLMDMGAAPGE